MKRKGRSGGTIENYRDHFERFMSDWLDCRLSKLALQPELVRARHEKLSEENGTYIANGCMRTLRAVYNHARNAARELPADNPVSAVDWNSERRRDTTLGLADLGGWFNKLAALENPVRREFHLFLRLSGRRPEAIKTARTEHLNFRRCVLHLPKPKDGEAKAFDIQLSRPMIRCQIRVLRFGPSFYPNQAAEWIFPADSKAGHLAEHKENREELSRWGNDLRQTFRTTTQSAGVPEPDVHLLMNDSMPGVNGGYITRDKLLRDHLRSGQEAISRKMMDAAQGAKQNEGQASAVWIVASSRKLAASM